MQTRRTLLLGQKGTQKFLHRYSEKLCSVGYLYDKHQRKRFPAVGVMSGADTLHSLTGLAFLIPHNQLRGEMR